MQAKNVLHISVAAAASIFLVGLTLHMPRTPSRVIGLALMVISFVLWAIARIQLGNSFAVRAKATALVTRGLYSKIRNPVYLFGTCWLAAYLLSIGRLARPIWPLLLLLVPLQIIRARREALLLQDRFGQDYRNYRRKTWF